MSANITRSRVLKLVWILLLLAGVLTYAYYHFFLHLVRVPTGAMANTIIPGDRLVVKKRAFGEITRGNVIIFNYPADSATKYIGRVIGLPNETIELRGKLVYINGGVLAEQRVTIIPHYGDQLLEEFSTEGSGPYRVFYSPASIPEASTTWMEEILDPMVPFK